MKTKADLANMTVKDLVTYYNENEKDAEKHITAKTFPNKEKLLEAIEKKGFVQKSSWTTFKVREQAKPDAEVGKVRKDSNIAGILAECNGTKTIAEIAADLIIDEKMVKFHLRGACRQHGYGFNITDGKVTLVPGVMLTEPKPKAEKKDKKENDTDKDA